MSYQPAATKREATLAIANTDTKDLNLMMDTANSSKQKRQINQAQKEKREAEAKARQEAEQNAKGGA
jgi:single-stranded DNA-specific DHH superfamily exonuclease